MPQKAIAHERSTQRSAARRARPAAVSLSSTNLSLCCPDRRPACGPLSPFFVGSGRAAGRASGRAQGLRGRCSWPSVRDPAGVSFIHPRRKERGRCSGAGWRPSGMIVRRGRRVHKGRRSNGLLLGSRRRRTSAPGRLFEAAVRGRTALGLEAEKARAGVSAQAARQPRTRARAANRVPGETNDKLSVLGGYGFYREPL